MNRFPNGWPVEEFLKTYLKNKRSYARKQGYLAEHSKQKKDESEEEDQNQEEDQEEEQEQGKGGEDNGYDGGRVEWDRGDGWHKGASNEDEDDDMYGSA